MRKITIPIIIVAAIVLVGCKSASEVHTQAAAPTAAAPAPPTPETPAQIMSEGTKYGNIGAAFMVILTVLAVKRS
jgi:hypothetical protein